MSFSEFVAARKAGKTPTLTELRRPSTASTGERTTAKKPAAAAPPPPPTAAQSRRRLRPRPSSRCDGWDDVDGAEDGEARGRRCYALVVAHALQALADELAAAPEGSAAHATLDRSWPRLDSDGACVLWVVGARGSAECWSADQGGFGDLHALWPAPGGWHVCLVGPELDHGASSSPPFAAGATPRDVRVTSHKGVLHDVAGALPRPSVVVAFNPGFGTLLVPIAGPWVPTLPHLLRADGAPLLLTHFNDKEGVGERDLLVADLKAQELLPDGSCPFGDDGDHAQSGSKSSLAALAAEAKSEKVRTELAHATTSKTTSSAFYWWVAAGTAAGAVHSGSDPAAAQAALRAMGDKLRQCAAKFALRDASTWLAIIRGDEHATEITAIEKSMLELVHEALLAAPQTGLIFHLHNGHQSLARCRQRALASRLAEAEAVAEECLVVARLMKEGAVLGAEMVKKNKVELEPGKEGVSESEA